MVENVILNIETLRGERKDGGEEEIYFWAITRIDDSGD